MLKREGDYTEEREREKERETTQRREREGGRLHRGGREGACIVHSGLSETKTKREGELHKCEREGEVSKPFPKPVYGSVWFRFENPS